MSLSYTPLPYYLLPEVPPQLLGFPRPKRNSRALGLLRYMEITMYRP